MERALDKPDGAADPNWLRFGVRGQNGLWGPTWKLWTQGAANRAEVHVGSRCMGGCFVFKRRTGCWSIAAAPFSGQTAPSEDSIGVDVTVMPVSSSESAVQPLLSITTTQRALTQPLVAGRFRYIAEIPAHPGMANETQIVALSLGGRASNALGDGLQGCIPLGFLAIADHLRIAVLYRAVRTADVDKLGYDLSTDGHVVDSVAPNR